MNMVVDSFLEFWLMILTSPDEDLGTELHVVDLHLSGSYNCYQSKDANSIPMVPVFCLSNTHIS